MPAVRVGWFHPTPQGERVMPIAVALPPIVQAYVERARQLTGDATMVQGELDRSTEGADLSAAFHHLEALDLQLRREDGSIIPTEDIGIQDTHRLLELAREAEREMDAECDEWGDVGDLFREPSESERQLEEDVQHDTELIEEMFPQSDGFRDWAIGKLDEDDFPRYQILVQLFDDSALP
ncbi:MAG: hypothetical protein ABIT20_06835 [Gemmatimonadaceae bacterium]